MEGLTDVAAQTLMGMNWSGNVRELENVIERAVIITRGDKLDIGDSLPNSFGTTHRDELVTIEENERKHILRVLEKTNWKISGENGAAKILGMKRTTLESRMKKLKLSRPN